ncbi:hypothetical protein MTY414_75790 [Mycolicibacterium mageritense]|nr:hypothetical protein MTY414_75790 [Mycolicibacterium mageritense]
MKPQSTITDVPPPSDRKNTLLLIMSTYVAMISAAPTVHVQRSVAMPIAAGDDADAYDYSMDLQDAALGYTGGTWFGATCAHPVMAVRRLHARLNRRWMGRGGASGRR